MSFLFKEDIFPDYVGSLCSGAGSSVTVYELYFFVLFLQTTRQYRNFDPRSLFKLNKPFDSEENVKNIGQLLPFKRITNFQFRF